MNLSPVQETHLARVATADNAWRTAVVNARARAKTIADLEVSDLLAVRDAEVRRAYEAGVPKIRIREDGLLTTSPSTLNASLARTAAREANDR